MSEEPGQERIPEPPRHRRKWTFWRFIIALFLYLWVALFLIVGGLGVVAFIIYDHITQPGVPGPAIEVEIPAGASGQRVAQVLEERDLVYHRAFFVLAMRLDKPPRPIIQGTYQLPRGLSPMELLHLLQKGPEFLAKIRITVPEGFSLRQAAELFEKPEAFIAAASDPVLITRLKIEADTLEGFLMPNTYFFDEQPTERQVVEKMTEQFEKEYTKLLLATPSAKAQNKLELITLASLVEEEAKVDSERPIVAAVLQNRLKSRMPLQMDSTLQYALNKYGQRMLDSDKQVDSPYNTYRYPGLPPGPISSPGASSIRAALKPAQVDYLYFVSNADGRTHTFSSTLAEHERAVKKFRKEISEQRRDVGRLQDLP